MNGGGQLVTHKNILRTMSFVPMCKSLRTYGILEGIVQEGKY
jgi:hypothetical protein